MRIITIETELCEIKAFYEYENYNEAIESAQEWVWQNAGNKEQAILQHENKHDEWALNQINGTEKDTY